MKDKRNLLKIASITEVIYVLVMLVYAILENKSSEEVIANFFFLSIGLVSSFILYKESKKNIDVLKKNKTSIILCSIWLFFEPIVPGILGFIFISLISDKKKKINLPDIKEEKKNTRSIIKSVILILLFLVIMFALPEKLFDKIPAYLVYVVIFLMVLIFNYNDLKNNFIIFVKNFKVYLPFVIKRYLMMLGIMLLVGIPIVLLNNGNTSSNQQALNVMFKKVPMFTLVLSTLYAPFVEENIFRLSLSKLFSNKTLFIIISGFLFGALHIIDKFTSVFDLLYIFQYGALGICLAKAYKDSNNIFVSISMHFIQNFIAAILILLMY